MRAKLNIIGCGSLGRSLARLWHEAQIFEIHQISNRSFESADQATQFIAAGQAVRALDQLTPADLYLIGVPDDSIEQVCQALATTGLLSSETIVFHCSGALGSGILASAQAQGARTASVHPVKSFADPDDAVRSFEGTGCGIEGDAAAQAALRPAFESIGAKIFEIDPIYKAIYHAGAVMACGYLASLVDAGLRCYERAGVDRETAESILRPLAEGTLDNIFRRGAAGALTGPIARGEARVVGAQLEALSEWDAELAELYRVVGRAALRISRQKSGASTAKLDELSRVLQR